MIPKSAIHWQGLVKAISRYRCKKQIPEGRSREHGGSSCPEPWYHAAGHGRSSTQVVLTQLVLAASRERKSSRPPATAVPVLNSYYQGTKIQPVAGDGRSSTKVVLPETTKVVVPENENPAGRRRQPFQQLQSLYYQRTKIQPAPGHSRSSTKLVLPENENPAGRRRRPSQY